jgi:hypothetical protein
MSPPFPPKPKIGPLVRRSLLAATLAAVPGCQREAIRIGAVRIGPPPFDERDYAGPEPADAAVPVDLTAPADAAVAPAPADASVAAAAADAASEVKAIEPPERPPPIRIGPPKRIRIGPPVRDDQIKPRSSIIRGVVTRADGVPLAHRSIRVELPSGTRIVATDAAGAFAIDGLPPGDYPVVVRATGFAPVKATVTAGRDAPAAAVTVR